MPRASKQPRPPRMLYFVRHGQYVLADSAEQGKLTALGRRQARLLARHFRNIEVDSIVSSDVERAIETAGLLAQQLRLEHQKRHAVLREVLPARVKGMVVPHDKRQEARERIELVYQRFFKTGGPRHQVIVCHGNLIRSLICRMMGSSASMFQQLVAHNTGVTSFAIDERGPRLVGFNVVSHLPPGARSVT